MAAVMSAGAQIKELDPLHIAEFDNYLRHGEYTPTEEELATGYEYDAPHDCFIQDTVYATSRLAPQGKNNYNETNIYDCNSMTPWIEGVKGYGIGEKVTVHLDYVNAGWIGITIVNGYSKNETAWKNNSRVKKLKLYFNDKPIYILNLKDEMGEQAFYWNEPINRNIEEFSITVEILDVYKGDKYDDTAISEILPLGCH